MGKYPGPDNLLNKYFYKFKYIFTPMLVHLFKIVFNIGDFWNVGRKGNVNDTKRPNYRGITFVSCLP